MLRQLVFLLQLEMKNYFFYRLSFTWEKTWPQLESRALKENNLKVQIYFFCVPPALGIAQIFKTLHLTSK